MISIVLCDDEKPFLDSMDELIKRYAAAADIEISITHFTDGSDLVKYYRLGFDIIFLDISMAKLNGIETAMQIRQMDKNVIIIFLTSVLKYALSGYALDAFNYLIKPITYKKLSTELNKAILKCSEIEQQYITLKNNDGIYKLYVKDILYIETHRRNTLIHTSSQDIVSFFSMKELEKKLEAFSFVRCHSSYIVNIMYIQAIVKLLITLTNEETIPISQQKRKTVMMQIAIYLGDKL